MTGLSNAGFSVDGAIARLGQCLDSARHQGLTVESLGDGLWRVVPLPLPGAKAIPLPKGKDTALAFMGLVHGNEVQGLDVLCELADGLARGWFRPSIPLAFVVGNMEGGRRGLRYLGRDLNRSFSLPDPLKPVNAGGHGEEHRARVIEPVLRRCGWLLDFHQTTQTSPHPFFIFPYTPEAYRWAREIDHRVPIVTHWGDAFSTEGMCTDEYVNAHAGIGLTVELGQAGVTDYQRGIGVLLGLRAVQSVTARLSGVSPPRVVAAECGLIYSWANIVPWPSGSVALDPGWNNFVPLKAGQRLGVCDGKEMTAPADGYMLFPKYLDAPGHPPDTKTPEELCRVMKIITEKDLPT